MYVDGSNLNSYTFAYDSAPTSHVGPIAEQENQPGCNMMNVWEAPDPLLRSLGTLNRPFKR
jgi:hypothetical protein